MQLFSRAGAVNSLKVLDYGVYLIKRLLVLLAFSLFSTAQTLFFVIKVKEMDINGVNRPAYCDHHHQEQKSHIQS